VGVIQVGQSTQFLDATLADIRGLLALGTVAVLALAWLVGWLLVRHAIRPVTELTAAADRIVASGNLNEQIPTPRSTDEVGVLLHSFNRMVEQLGGSFRQQQQLLADTSHELRNPLMAIRANLDVIESSDTLDDHYEAAAEAKIEVARMSRLVSDLLLLGHGDAGLPLNQREVDVVELLDKLVERARDLNIERAIQFVRQADIAIVFGDRDRLWQAFWNLFENAFRYSGETGTIEVGVEKQEQQVRIWVRDDGPGIPAEHQDRVFERFYRVNRARSRRSDGSGLGLAIVKYVVEAHGGSVSLISTLGDGTSFMTVLPLALTDGSDSSPSAFRKESGELLRLG